MNLQKPQLGDDMEWSVIMTDLLLLSALVLGSIVFMFTFILSKKSGKYYLAPIITILISAVIVAYGLFFAQGFDGMAYLLIGVGFLIVSILGTLFLPLLARRGKPQSLNKGDKISLFILPVIFLAILWIGFGSVEDYWIIDQADTEPAETEGYRISTISEGRKAVTILLGEEYLGKEIEVENVHVQGSTEIILRFEDEGNEDKVPYLQIGLNEINKPLKIQTTDGMVFEQIDINQ